jgi:GT2 family glycosyltransferase
MIKTSVVILNWNGQVFLQKFLAGIVQYTEDAQTQVVVADNGSTDNSPDYLAKNFPALRIIKLDRNYGFTGGYNRAIAQIESPYTVLLNSDIEVAPRWLLPLTEHLDTHPRTAACMPTILAEQRKTHFEYAGAAGGFIDILGYPFCRGRILSNIEANYGQYAAPMPVFWASGACMMVRTAVYKELGGLDDDFFTHMEELDLCWRMQNAGYEIYSIPQSAVYHVGGGTLPNDHPQKLFFNYRNNLLMLYKNLPARNFYIVLAVRLVLDGLSALMYLLKGKTPFFVAVVRAHRQFFAMRKGKRLPNRRLPFSKLKGVYPKSILLAYFLGGKKTFSKIRGLQP